MKVALTFDMRCFAFIILLSSSGFYATAQIPPSTTTPDTVTISPNILRINAQVISADKTIATIKVLEVVGYGSGVTNILSAGQEITVRLTDNMIHLTANQKIDADLREKMGADASISTYILLNARKVRP
jgi:hypothetical protein